MARQIPLAVFAEQLITSMLISYRASAGLLRAVRQFVQGRDHTAFYKKVAKQEMRTFEYMMELFLVHRKQIRHRDPQAHLKHLKVMPAVSPVVDKCIECGFCEPRCPSRNLTTTPRQRIAVLREIERLLKLKDPANDAIADELSL